MARLMISSNCRYFLMISISVLAISSPAMAQKIPMPNVSESVDNRSVDLFTGFSRYTPPTISIGSGEGVLIRSAKFDERLFTDSFFGVWADGKFSYNNQSVAFGEKYSSNGNVSYTNCDQYIITVTSGTCSSADEKLEFNYNAAITNIDERRIAGVIVYTDPSGNKAEYKAALTQTIFPASFPTEEFKDRGGHLTSYLTPNGSRTRTYYEMRNSYFTDVRIRFVSNNSGYAMLYTYYSDSLGDSTTAFPFQDQTQSKIQSKYGYNKLKSIRVVNLSVDTCNQQTWTCTNNLNTPEWAFDGQIGYKTSKVVANDPNKEWIYSGLVLAEMSMTNPLGQKHTYSKYEYKMPSGKFLKRAFVQDSRYASPYQSYTYFGYTSNEQFEQFQAYRHSLMTPWELEQEQQTPPPKWCGEEGGPCVAGKFGVDTGVGIWNYDFRNNSRQYPELMPDGQDPKFYVDANSGTTTVTDPLGNVTTYYSDKIRELEEVGFKSVQDANGRITRYYYENPNQDYLTKIVYPEGNSVELQYDSRNNLIKRIDKPKPGSDLTSTEWLAGYDLTCNNMVTCNKPNWTRDAKGNQTDYTYDPVHGGILTETGPADGNGVRPQTRYSYLPFYAQVKSDNGTMVNAEGPIYKLTKISVCTAASGGNPASCVGSAGEQVKEFFYNHPNLLKTSETIRNGDGSFSATTSYTYDYFGNITVVDGPRTDVDDRSYTTWDALRRKVFEIGPDPDGNGPLKRSIAKHYYDQDGNEIRTEAGAGAAIDGSDFVWVSAKKVTFDAANRPVKTEVVVP